MADRARAHARRLRLPRLALVAALLLAAGAILPAAERQEEAQAPIRVLAYNIKRGLGMDGRTDIERAAAVINRLRPDLAALQEIDVGVARSGRVDQAKALARLTGMTGFYAEFMDYQGGRYGQMLLSRFPVLESRRLALPDGQEEPRASAVMRVRAPSGELTIACVHLYRTEADRLAQARRLAEALGGRSRPVILAGDFNSRRGDPVMIDLEKTYANPPKQGPPNTFPAPSPRAEIDFILFTPKDAFVVKEYRVIQEPVVSDHRPVLMVLQPTNVAQEQQQPTGN